MATYESRYSLISADTHSADELTFYEACKALVAAREAGVITDHTHIRRDGRAVAFFSEWSKTIRPMWDATGAERQNVLDLWSEPSEADRKAARPVISR